MGKGGWVRKIQSRQFDWSKLNGNPGYFRRQHQEGNLLPNEDIKRPSVQLRTHGDDHETDE